MTAELPSVHPGDVLSEDFLKPMGISAYRLAREIGVPPIRISEIVRHRRPVTLDTAMRLARYFGTSAELWLGLQMDYDLEQIRRNRAEVYEAINPLRWPEAPRAA